MQENCIKVGKYQIGLNLRGNISPVFPEMKKDLESPNLNVV